MDNIVVIAASRVTEAEVLHARLGLRFGRLDLASKLAVLAVESLGIDFSQQRRDRVGICLAASAASLAADIDFWAGRDEIAGPSPSLFAYALPSAAIGEIAIRHQLIGPNLCFVGDDIVLPEARDMIQRGEADACVGVWCNLISPAAAQMIQSPSVARACAVFLQRGGDGSPVLRETDRDMESLCAVLCARNS